MKKIIKFIRNNILGLLVGLSLCLNGVIIAENMITSEQVSYSNDKTSETTVKGNLDELFSAVDINERLGNNDISTIGEDGTITGAISAQQTNISNKTELKETNYDKSVNQLSAVIDVISYLNGFASWKIVGAYNKPTHSISNYNLYGQMITTSPIVKNTVLFTTVSNSISYRALNYFRGHLGNAVGSPTSAGPMIFLFYNISTGVTYNGYYYNGNFCTGEDLPSGNYAFTFTYSV